MRRIYFLTGLIALMIAIGCRKDTIPTVDTGSTTGGTTTIANGKPLPAGAGDGVTFINNGTSAIFNIYAPGKNSMSVIGEFNNWQPTAMNETTDGNNWWIQIDNLNANTEYAYQFVADGTLKVADPYCEKVLDPDNDKYILSSVYPNLKAYPTGQTGIVSVMQANQTAYTWKNTTFTRPDKKNLVIYELLVRDFIPTHTYKQVTDSLSYLAKLGVNAIELMPVNEFEGNSSWGYNPNFYFAPDKYYGTKNDLKTLIDACHSAGMAVILDMVLNHSMNSSPMAQLYWDAANTRPAANNPWFNPVATHLYNVGNDFNHESAATKYFAKNVMKWWIQQYHIDGYRFDLSKGFTQHVSTTDAEMSAYDASRVAIWKDYKNFINSVDNNNFYTILEHFAVDQEEKELSDNGMMLWNNLNYAFNESTMGYVSTSDISRAYFTGHTGFTVPDYNVTYMESHDEERIMYKNEQYGNASGSYNVKAIATGLARNEAAAAFLLTSPGPKMIWQFGELGYDINIDYNGRTGEKPLHPDYLNDANRKKLFNAYAKLIRMKINNPVFTSSSIRVTGTGAVKTETITGSGIYVVVAGNFDVVNQAASITFPTNGTYYDYMTGATVNITSPLSVTYAPGEYHIYSSAALK